MEPVTSRREFLTQVGGAWLAANLSGILALSARAREAAAQERPLTTLTAAESRALDAVSAQILPSGELPGARDAGVVHFADLALGSFFAGQLPDVRGGLADLDARARTLGAGDFAGLDDARQQGLLHEIEQSPAFQTIWMLTVIGVFAEPAYGGNLDGAAGKLLGVARAPAYQPPFGYYDAHAGVDE